MSSLSDRIEKYLKTLIERSETNEVEIQRIELAETFCCVPSQITYVLGTRFTMDEGFLIESKRGGKGFVRIKKIHANTGFPGGLSQSQGNAIVETLAEQKALTSREADMIRAIIKREVLGVPVRERDELRGRIIGTVIKFVEDEKNAL